MHLTIDLPLIANLDLVYYTTILEYFRFLYCLFRLFFDVDYLGQHNRGYYKFHIWKYRQRNNDFRLQAQSQTSDLIQPPCSKPVRVGFILFTFGKHSLCASNCKAYSYR